MRSIACAMISFLFFYIVFHASDEPVADSFRMGSVVIGYILLLASFVLMVFGL